MADHPLLFSDSMVRAILASQKTQTRRWPAQRYAKWQVGDRIWVREACRPVLYQGGTGMYEGTVSQHIEYRASKGESLALRCVSASSGCLYVSDESQYRKWFHDAVWWNSRDTRDGPWRPSIHMPKWAARLWLEIVSLRMEPLQAITFGDVKAEGVVLLGGEARTTARKVFAGLWNSINGCRCPWSSNPAVAAITFKRIEVTNA